MSDPVTVSTFYSETGKLENNWKENVNGESYLQRIREGRPDLFGAGHFLLIAELQNRAREVEQTYADTYGWTINEQLNDAYRTERGLEEAPPRVIEDPDEFLEVLPAREPSENANTKYSILETEFELIPKSDGARFGKVC